LIAGQVTVASHLEAAKVRPDERYSMEPVRRRSPSWRPACSCSTPALRPGEEAN